MDRTALERLLHAGEFTASDLVQETQFEDLDEILTLLKRYCPLEEVRDALLKRTAVVPLAEFKALKILYFRHFHARKH